MLFRAPANELLGYAGHQAGAITAGAIRIDPAPMREPLQRGQSALHDLMRGRLAELDDKPGAAGIVIGMAVKEALTHTMFNKQRPAGREIQNFNACHLKL